MYKTRVRDSNICPPPLCKKPHARQTMLTAFVFFCLDELKSQTAHLEMEEGL